MTRHEIRKRKRIRRLVALILLFVLLLFFLWLFLRKKDFTYSYSKDAFFIEEQFNSKENSYLFTIKKDAKEYHTILTNVNFYAKKIISNIIEYQENDETCIVIESSKVKINPLCIKNNEQISYHLTSEKMKKNFDINFLEQNPTTYEQIKIENFQHRNYYIWNYRGFYHLNENHLETISLFSKDIYDAKLITKTNDYLFIPNYDEEHYFKTCYLIQPKTGKQEVWNLKEPIYFDSIILGAYNEEIYLVDKHEKVEWKLNLKKKTMEKVGTESKGGITYNNGFIEVSMTKLMNQENTFQGLSVIDYEVNQGIYKTFAGNKIKIREEAPTKIVQKEDESLFYLVDDTLYSYTEFFGEIKVMSYFEWHFNHENVIFIF